MYKISYKMKKRIINKEDYPMVLNWDNYQNTHTKLLCECQGCACEVFKSITILDKQKRCYCRKCGNNIQAKQTKLERYGHENYNNIEKYNKTNLEKYGVKNVFQDEKIKEKITLKNMKKYGVSSPMKSSIIKERQKNTLLEKYGVIAPMQLKYYKNQWQNKKDEILFKQYKTKKANNTFTTSKIENKCYELLITKYDVDDVFRDYKEDKRYPFACDFYIKSVDLFIECNFHWTHGREPFDGNNIVHQKILKKWEEKSEISKFYKNAIEVWVNRDMNKIKTAKNNNLKYLIFYNLKEFEKWLYLVE